MSSKSKTTDAPPTELRSAEEWAREIAKACTPDKEPNAAIYVFRTIVESIQADAAASAQGKAAVLPETHVVVPKEPTSEMVKATKSSMESVDNAIVIASIHGASVEWQDDKPPLYHAYKAMLYAAPPCNLLTETAVADKARTEILKLKIPFPDWIRDPATHEVFDMGLNAKNDAIRALISKEVKP